jgi:hypothetical protein
MKKKSLAMHVVTTTKRVGDKVYRCHLLCHGYREDGKVKKKTLANLSHLPDDIIDLIRKALKGEIVQAADPGATPSGGDAGNPFQALDPEAEHELEKGGAHGQVMVALKAIRELGLPELISERPCPERDLVLAMIVSRIVNPQSKLATVSWWKTTTLADQLDLEDVDEDALCAAMDWLGPRQAAIETALATRHLEAGGTAMYDLSSSYMEGEACPLARHGYSRDKKRGKVQINFGLLADRKGRPLSLEVYPGNRTDSTTFYPMVERVRRQYKLEKIVMVGDRGILGTKNIEILKRMEGVEWISALRPVSVKELVKNNKIKPSLFDENNILEIHAPDDYPGERLIFCRNTALAKKRRHSRDDMLEKTENMHNITFEEALDGIYVIRTSLKSETIDSAGVVREYKKLTNIERAFRSIKAEDFNLIPIYHFDENRVKTHIFICMLSYYVLWHIKEAWRPLTFEDEEIDLKE